MEPADVQICRGFTVRQWKTLHPLLVSGDEPAWTIAIEVFRRRIKERFLSCIEALIQADGGEKADVEVAPDAAVDGSTFPKETTIVPGFACMALCCLLIDTLQSFRNGATASTAEQFRSFLKLGSFGQAFADDRVANQFVRGVRHGILHEGETRGWILWRAEPATGLVEVLEDGRFILNRTAFYESVRRELDAYIDALRRGDLELRRRFQGQMDDMLGLC